MLCCNSHMSVTPKSRAVCRGLLKDGVESAQGVAILAVRLSNTGQVQVNYGEAARFFIRHEDSLRPLIIGQGAADHPVRHRPGRCW
jgi:hypothetical protein